MTMLRVLYVDDDPDIREAAELCLRMDPDIEVQVADSGAAALALLATDAPRPDVVLLDVMMPQMDGPALLAAIRARPGAQPPAIFMTARAMPEERARLMALGAVGVITKPFNPLGLAAEVRGLVSGVG